MEFATEMVIKSSLQNARIAEVPITLHPDGRKAHAPHLETFRDGWRTLRFFLMYCPRWLFLYPGAALVALGLAGYALAHAGRAHRGRALRRAHAARSRARHPARVPVGDLRHVRQNVCDREACCRRTERMERFYRVVTLERGLIAGAARAGGGLLLLGGREQWRLARLRQSGLRETMRLVVPGVMLTALGFQTVLGSFLIGHRALECAADADFIEVPCAVVVITGSAGLIGSEAVGYYCRARLPRRRHRQRHAPRFFGAEASTRVEARRARQRATPQYTHHDVDIRDRAAIERIFRRLRPRHRAGRPRRRPAVARLGGPRPVHGLRGQRQRHAELLEATRQFAPRRRSSSPRPTRSTATARTSCRWSRRRRAGRSSRPPVRDGIDETMSDRRTHALALRRLEGGGRPAGAGVRPLLRHADRCFRGGCLTGPDHSGPQLHGFLAYLMRCAVERHAVHGLRLQGQAGARQHPQRTIWSRPSSISSEHRASARSTTSAAAALSNCSMLEAIELCEEITGKQPDWTLRRDEPRRATTSGGSADTRKFSATIRTGIPQFDLAATRSSRCSTERSPLGA